MGKVINLENKKEGEHMGTYNVLSVAHVFLTYEGMTQKKLQKLCYYAQAWHLAVNGIPLIKDRFEAWIHGPVSPALYSEYRDYKWSTIPRRKKDVEEISNDDIKRFLNIIWDMYGGNTADELEEMTHAEQPWKNARGNIESWKPSDRVISHDDMKTYYSNLLNDD